MRTSLAILMLVGVCPAQDSHGFGTGPVAAAVLAALPLNLDPATRAQLAASGSTSTFSKGQSRVDLCPDPDLRADLARSLASGHPDIGIQTLVLAAMPPGLLSRSDRDLVLYNRIHRFRSMAGILYYSSTRGKFRTLFTTSHLVRAAGDRAALADPEYTAVEPSHPFLLEQDDTTFGRNLYAVTVSSRPGGAVALTMSNLERVTWGFIPVLAPGAIRLTLVIKPAADGRALYFYGNVRISSAMVMEEQVRISFYNRIMALSAWYGAQVAGA
jgi:hypothetical protein